MKRVQFIFSVIAAGLVLPASFAAAVTPSAAATQKAAAPTTIGHDAHIADKATLGRDEVFVSQSAQGVNPLTGKSIRSEEMEHTLRERTIEARIAEADLAIAKSRSDVRKLGSDQGGAAPARVPEAVRQQAASVVDKASASKKKPTPKNTKVVAPEPAVATIQRPPERPRFIGMMDSGAGKVAMVAFLGRTVEVKEGSNVQGISVSSISNGAAVINGVPSPLEQGVSTINLPETRQPVQPGSALAQATPQPSYKGVVVQGVNTPAMQPMAPGSPMPAAGTTPVRFPNDLYTR